MERDDPSQQKGTQELRKEREETVCDSSKMMISLSSSSAAQPGEKHSSNVATGLLLIRNSAASERGRVRPGAGGQSTGIWLSRKKRVGL